jgi:hypothetical protein
MTHQSPFDFLGYKLLRADLHRENDGMIEMFSIKIPQVLFDEAKSILSLDCTFSYQYKNNAVSSLFFRGAYKINDLEWKKELNDLQLMNTLFAVLFPYIRASVEQYTDDIRGHLVIPIIDLRNVNLNVGITFKPNIQN